ncbi:MAG: type II toxin-antitoxin system VapC family toxin [Gammaproteobacteria bacterium]|nr:type II toxin-antitoxin system VapC family toxin [Gammaproteobacteria bacterium]
MTARLLDVNVLVALTWPTHVHHLAARTWFDRESAAGWATCPITQLGFVRVSSNPKAIPDAVRPQQAIAMFQQMTRLPGHRFWPDDVPVTATGPFASLSLVGHRQVTDAYLVALARHHGGKLATLDRGVSGLIAAREERSQWVELIPVEG